MNGLPMSNGNETGSAELMTAYIDGDLAPDDAAQLERELAESPQAREELDELRKMVQLVSGLPAVEAPADFYDKVSRRIKRRQMMRADSLLLNLISLPFQVLSILVILAIAALYMFAQLEQAPQEQLERDPAAQPDRDPADSDGPRPIIP